MPEVVVPVDAGTLARPAHTEPDDDFLYDSVVLSDRSVQDRQRTGPWRGM
jgi:hypothetical protein